jgi:hypothetical protein
MKKQEIEMAKKNPDEIVLNFKGMWIKIISKCQSIPIRMAKMKKTDPSKCW